MQQEATIDPSTNVHVRQPWRFTFGKHTGLTVLEVAERSGSYMAWCVASDLHNQYPEFKAALIEEGLFETISDEAVRVKLDLKRRASEKKRELDEQVQAGAIVCKDVMKMRALASSLAQTEDSEQVDPAGVSEGTVIARAEQEVRNSRAAVLAEESSTVAEEGGTYDDDDTSGDDYPDDDRRRSQKKSSAVAVGRSAEFRWRMARH